MRFLIGLMMSALACQAQGSCPDSQAVRGRAATTPVHAFREIAFREIAFREIKDPQTGAHWLILSNAANPAGPGRMVLARNDNPCIVIADAEEAAPVVAVHLGDRMVVEEHTRVAEAFLEGVALGPAVAGASFSVRLKVGGQVVRAVAIAPGRAALMPEPGIPSTGGRR
jgi:hypothetical protein